jgi:YVTN family beta-propeller protein
VTNRIYIADTTSGYVSVINGASHSVSDAVDAQNRPWKLPE